MMLLWLALSGCGPKHAVHAQYERVYEQSTRHLVVYQDVHTALNVRGTYLTPQFREAMAAERSRLLGTTEAEDQAFDKTLQEDGKAYHEVVFSADSGLEGGDRFGTTDEGWIVRLYADGHEEQLVTLFKVRNPNVMQRALYPHFNIWSDLWIARFARTIQEPRHVVMTFGSGYGNGRLEWDVPEAAGGTAQAAMGVGKPVGSLP